MTGLVILVGFFVIVTVLLWVSRHQRQDAPQPGAPDGGVDIARQVEQGTLAAWRQENVADDAGSGQFGNLFRYPEQ